MRRTLIVTLIAGMACACAEAPVQKAESKTSVPVEKAPSTTAAPRTVAVAPGGDAPAYPVVFDDVAMLAQLGLSFGNGWGGVYDAKPLKHRCYYYGDGGYGFSMSDDLLAGFKAQGFTLRTACLGMMSGIRFDPETGERLPTVMLIDAKAIEAFGFPGEAGSVSDEIPLVLPACFRGGTPVEDCALNYDMLSGDRMNTATRARLKKAAGAASAGVAQALASGQFTRECGPAESNFRNGCRTETYPDTPDNIYIKGKFAREPVGGSQYPVGVIDVSPVFAKGYAYALYADGAAGPSANIESEDLVVNKKRRASIATIRALKAATRQ